MIAHKNAFDVVRCIDSFMSLRSIEEESLLSSTPCDMSLILSLCLLLNLRPLFRRASNRDYELYS